VARTLRLPKSTAYRILRTLETAGLVTQAGDDRRYSLGSLLYELASGTNRSSLIEGARPLMVRLRDECNETVALHVLQGAGWAAISQVESRQELRRTIMNLGSPTPLHAGAAGKLFLAFLPERDRERYCKDHELNAITPHTPTNRRRLLEELALIRRRGYSTSQQEVAIGVAGVVMPITRPDGSVKEALGVSGPLVRFTPKAVAAIRAGLEEAVTKLSQLCTSDALTARPPSVGAGGDEDAKAGARFGSQLAKRNRKEQV
jgi:DNA-binding IclR family transcriptional regulator